MKWLLNLFKSEPEEPELVHPIFGIMASYKSKDGYTFWQTYEEFQSDLGEIDITIDGDENGPSEDLVKLWQEIVAHFDQWKAKAEPMLRERMREFEHEVHFDQLRLSGFGIHTKGREAIDWDMSFELEEHYMLYTVCFKDGEPTLVHADS